MEREVPRIQQITAIVWPAFLTSSAATIIFFTLFDPAMLLAGTALAEMSRLGAYTIGFFMFWALTLTTSGLTCYFARPCDKVNQTGSVGTLKREGHRHSDDIKRAV